MKKKKKIGLFKQLRSFIFVHEFAPVKNTERYIRRYTHEYPLTFPILYHGCIWLRPYYEFLESKFKDFVYYPIHYFFRKYDIVRTKLPRYRYHDPDEVMFHACFQILADFVLNDVNVKTPEEALSKIETYYNERSYDPTESNRIIYELYKWWILEYPTRKDVWEESKEIQSFLHTFYEQQDQAMFLKLAQVRRALWV